LRRQDYDYEIIVVNDGSPDNTLSVLRKFVHKIKNMRIVNYSRNRGKGYAVRRGMSKATGKYRLFMDADNSVQITEVNKFLTQARKGADVVVGSIAFQKDARHSAWYRKVLSSMSKILIRSVTALGVYDTQRGFKLFSARAAKTIFSKQTIDRWAFDIELLVIAQTNRFKIKELQVAWNNPDGSKVQLRHYINTLIELGKIVKNKFQGVYMSGRG
jgi:dolichyl-phosphate beta-glucosyltransferase